ncbi:MAG: hypothetical protein ACI4GD_01310 [Lachnospiraceae bacterium]
MNFNPYEWEAYVRKKQMDNDMAVEREWAINKERIYLAQRKVQLNEYHKENAKARYVEVLVDVDGQLKYEVHNPLLKVPTREIANFRIIQLTELRSSEGEEGIYLLKIQVGEVMRDIYISSDKAGNPKYFLKKITSVGGRIFANKATEQMAILEGLWSTLVACCQEKRVIPSHCGWIRSEEDKFIFVESGETLWKEVMQKAK